MATLTSGNKAQMSEMLAKQEEEERVTRKRKADQLEEVSTKKHPSAPECPVCPEFLHQNFVTILSKFCHNLIKFGAGLL